MTENRTPAPGPKRQVTVMLDGDILDAIEEHAITLREKRNAVIQRVLLEYLISRDLWPPKTEKHPWD